MSRRRPLVFSMVLCLALLPGSAAAGGPQFRRGRRASATRTSRTTATAATTSGTTSSTSPTTRDRRPDGRRDDHGTGDPGPVALQPRPRRADGALDHDRRPGRALVPTSAASSGSPHARASRRGSPFTAVVAYDGVPAIFDEPSLGASGFFHTDDGALVAGQPHGASTWFPVNDHPLDKAVLRVPHHGPRGPRGRRQRRLVGRGPSGGWTTWTWEARSRWRRTSTTHGDRRVRPRRVSGGPASGYWDADRSRPLRCLPAAPRTGAHFALSQPDDSAYKRLATTITVPAGGADAVLLGHPGDRGVLGLRLRRGAHPGVDDWTTLPDLNGHTGQDGGGLSLLDRPPVPRPLPDRRR